MASTFSPELLPGCLGAMDHIFCYGTLYDKSVQSQRFNRGIPWIRYFCTCFAISSVEADEECVGLLYQALYLDDGVLAGNRPAVLRAVHIIEEMGPSLGLHIYLQQQRQHLFPTSCEVLASNLDILGAPVGNYLHCSRFITNKCAESKKLLSSLVDGWPFTLLRMCGGFCKMVHLTWVTPQSVASDALVSFRKDVRQCFVLCSAIEVSGSAWKQAQLGLRFGGLGLRSLSCHAAAAFIASLSSSGLGLFNNRHLQQAVVAYRFPYTTQSRLSLLLLLPLLRESCPAELMKISSNLCWKHLPQQTKPNFCLF